MDKIIKLTEDTLELVNGGVSDDPQATPQCPRCTTRIVKVPGGYRCPDCGRLFDLRLVEITDSENIPMAGAAGPRPGMKK